MRKKTEFDQTAFFDFLFNMLLIFVVLFIIALLQTNPKKKDNEGIKVDDRFMIIMSWGEDLDDDVDIYVKDPLDHLVYFRRHDDGLMHLDRDDLGRRNDTIFTTDGKTIVVRKNEERVTIRGIVPGEYIVNVHMYYKKSSDPVTVTVRLLELRGADSEAITETVILNQNGDEGTAFRFTLDEGGNITNKNKDQISLYTFQVHRGGQ